METLKTILKEQFGFVTHAQALELKKTLPDFPVVIRWACGPRERTTLNTLDLRISEGLKAEGEYLRGVFIEASKCDELKKALAI